MDPKEIDTFKWSPKRVTIKDGPRAALDNCMSGYPIAKDGYNYFFDSIEGKCNIFLNTNIEKFDIVRKSVTFQGTEKKLIEFDYEVLLTFILPIIV